MPTKNTDEKKPITVDGPVGLTAVEAAKLEQYQEAISRRVMNEEVRRTAYEARIAKEQAKCRPLFERVEFCMALDAPSVNSAGQRGQTLRSGSEEVQHQTVQLFPHRERLWVLGLAELPDLEAQTAAIDLLESFGLAWKILLWGIRQSIRERSTADH